MTRPAPYVGDDAGQFFWRNCLENDRRLFALASQPGLWLSDYPYFLTISVSGLEEICPVFHFCHFHWKFA